MWQAVFTEKLRVGGKQMASSFKKNTRERGDAARRSDFQTHGLPPKQRRGLIKSSQRWKETPCVLKLLKNDSDENYSIPAPPLSTFSALFFS